MKFSIKIAFCLVFTGVFYSCNKSLSPSKKNPTSSIGDYEEDLSAVRIKYDKKPSKEVTSEKKISKEKPIATSSANLEIPYNINQKLDAVLDTLSNRNKNIKYVQGYRIQVYVGNDRKEYDEARSFIAQMHSELNLYPSFNPPTYRLKAGDFTTKMDAERFHSSIKNRYSASMIIADRIDIRRSMLIK